MKTRITSCIIPRRKLSREYILLIILKRLKKSPGSPNQENRCSQFQINFVMQEQLILDRGVSKWLMFSKIFYLNNSSVQNISMIEHWWKNMKMQIKLEVMKRFLYFVHVWIHYDRHLFSVEIIKDSSMLLTFQNLKNFNHSMWVMIRKLWILLQMDSIVSLLLMMDKLPFMMFKMTFYSSLRLKSQSKVKLLHFQKKQSEI